MTKLLSVFARDERGNFALLAGIFGILLVAAIGGAVDLSMQVSAQDRVQQALDAAVLAGAKELETGTAESARVQLRRFLDANLPGGLRRLAITETIDKKAGLVTATLAAQVTPNFLPLMQTDTLPILATSASSVQNRQFTDFYFLLDASESMNIAANEAERKTLEAYTQSVNNRPCAFACHVVEPTLSPLSVFQMNQVAGARLRIDVLREAAVKMIDKILAGAADPNSRTRTRISISQFSDVFREALALSSDKARLKAAVNTLAVDSAHTDINGAIEAFARLIGVQGDGGTQAEARRVALIVTDGVRDTGGWSRASLGTLDTKRCNLIKAKGITLAVLEVKYVETDDRYGFFRDRVAWYYPSISTALKACATPGYYAVAADADDAAHKLQSLTDELLTPRRRITQ